MSLLTHKGEGGGVVKIIKVSFLQYLNITMSQ